MRTVTFFYKARYNTNNLVRSYKTTDEIKTFEGREVIEKTI